MRADAYRLFADVLTAEAYLNVPDLPLLLNL